MKIAFSPTANADDFFDRPGPVQRVSGMPRPWHHKAATVIWRLGGVGPVQRGEGFFIPQARRCVLSPLRQEFKTSPGTAETNINTRFSV